MSEQKMPMLEANQARRRTKPNLWTWLFAWSVIAFGTGVFASGCGVSADEICNVKCKCEGCSQEQRDDCESDVNATVNKAQDLGCSSEYANWLSCVEQEAECRNGETFAWDGCEIEEDALAACGGGDACSAAAKKLCDECKFSCSNPDPSACTGRNACLSACVVNATCEEIATSASGYSSCVSACP
jgi:hypothetical protein